MIKQKIYTEIDESASQTVARHSAKKVIGENVFAAIVGRKVWAQYRAECVGGNNQIDGDFYQSTVDGSTCVFVSIGNIDRVFHPRFEGSVYTAEYMNSNAETGHFTAVDLQVWADFQNLFVISIKWAVKCVSNGSGVSRLVFSKV